jgi:hypothetical protein
MEQLLQDPGLPHQVDWTRVKKRRDVALVVNAAIDAYTGDPIPTNGFLSHCRTLAVMAPLQGDKGPNAWQDNIKWLRAQTVRR